MTTTEAGPSLPLGERTVIVDLNTATVSYLWTSATILLPKEGDRLAV
jgi:hypothetical protein